MPSVKLTFTVNPPATALSTPTVNDRLPLSSPALASAMLSVAVSALVIVPVAVPPATLVFYGLALFNASKFTLDEVKWLGISELVLGIIALFWLQAGLMFWALGFGVLHIFYGGLMYLRYERKDAINK